FCCHRSSLPLSLLVLLRPLRPTLFPYTTLFRSPTVLRNTRRACTTCSATASTPGRLSTNRGARHFSVTSAASTRRAASLSTTPSDRKSTRLNSSHVKISYAVFCLKKKNQQNTDT